MENKKKVYISGKMSGLEEEEFKAIFKEAENELIEKGYEVINPCEIDYISENYAGQLLIALGELTKCDAIYLLYNWKNSNGARCEYWFAKGMGLEIMSEEDTDKEVEELEALIDTANERITELLSDDENIEESAEKLLRRAKAYHDWASEVDEHLANFIEHKMGYWRGEVVEYDTVLYRLKEEYEEKNITKEAYDKMKCFLYEDIKDGYAGVKWDW